MYIYKIIIENFRSIKKLEWKPNKNVNVIIGPNGCGKSTLAIRIFNGTIEHYLTLTIMIETRQTLF